mmetsp:Transcript_28481/g.36966  ORF Transcript_28481/g.36966 Transcript_28481/m.36966 type:complete len:214 (-) Transcript_28481:616-1257(-)
MCRTMFNSLAEEVTKSVEPNAGVEVESEEEVESFSVLHDRTQGTENLLDESVPKFPLSSNSQQSLGNEILDDGYKERFLEEFKKKLHKGYKVRKHGRSGIKKKRILQCDVDCTKLTWKTASRTSPKSGNQYEIAFSDITEIRAGTDPDPDFPKYAATPTLRKSAQPSDANKLLSVIWQDRTLDLQLSKPESCQELLLGLRLLLEERKSKDRVR